MDFCKTAIVTAALLILVLCAKPLREPANYTYRIIRSYPHDATAFCQGLLFHNGFLYESTGLYGRSSIRKIDLSTGNILQMDTLPSNLFGEGLARLDNKLVQLTWRSRKGFVRDLKTFKILQPFHYPTQGWGITFDGSQLIMSNGTSTLFFLDTSTLGITDTLAVHCQTHVVPLLNELEYVKGKIYANVWKTDSIAIIDPQSGHVDAWIDCSGLLKPADTMGIHCDVLNGIAYDKQNDRLFVTGKLWPKVFEITVKEK